MSTEHFINKARATFFVTQLTVIKKPFILYTRVLVYFVPLTGIYGVKKVADLAAFSKGLLARSDLLAYGK